MKIITTFVMDMNETKKNDMNITTKIKTENK